MGLVSFLFSTIGKSIDILFFMLDLHFCIVNSLVRLLGVLISFLNSLPALLLNSLEELWNLVLFCVFTASEGITTAAQSALVGWHQLVGCTSESFKMVGHLSSYILVRAKDLLHRWVLSGHCFLLQLWEAWGITLSLSLYLLNTLVNMLLIGMQSCYSAVVWVCVAVCGSLQKAVELTLALFTILYSSVLSITVLLWTPCQFALEFLWSLAHVFISVFLLNAYGLALSVGVVLAATLYLNADLPRRSVRRVLRYVSGIPALCRLRRALCRLYPLALERAQTVLEMGVWLQRGVRAAEGQNRGASDGTRPPALTVQQGPSAGGGTAGGRSQQEEAAPELPGISAGDCRGQPVDSLLTLLKEQEDLKKCVICQDSRKTVLLLPCRHLCLCRNCANLLLSLPVYRHNCPLCRHMILRTMDVYL
ncbi:E3 ubiquitin-protein ligase RNF26 [Anguilla anguilla]|uniref:E3 ubiquitin-protein ligase RNF26 n=1 Tax=Anguilla anguilla TaxID=7936 RepID=UPI0015AEAF68|nr:E3 ubiquitin-protein ligase RNF26 [Anguilla anguilla]